MGGSGWGSAARCGRRSNAATGASSRRRWHGCATTSRPCGRAGRRSAASSRSPTTAPTTSSACSRRSVALAATTHEDLRIDIAAVNHAMVRAAGEVADGIHVHPLHSVHYLHRRLMPALEEGTARAGRSVARRRLDDPGGRRTGRHAARSGRRWSTSRAGRSRSTGPHATTPSSSTTSASRARRPASTSGSRPATSPGCPP